MKKRWIGLVVSALLSAGCAPQVIETPGGAVECYSKKCVNEATTWTRQHNSQMAKVEREEQKRQEKAAQEAKDLQENPWRTFSVAQVTQMAKQNQIALFQITRKNNQITEVAGIDLRSLESGVNVYGHSDPYTHLTPRHPAATLPAHESLWPMVRHPPTRAHPGCRASGAHPQPPRPGGTGV